LVSGASIAEVRISEKKEPEKQITEELFRSIIARTARDSSLTTTAFTG